MVLPHRTILLEPLPHEVTIAEVGTLYGGFAREIFRNARPKQLHLIDHEIGPRVRWPKKTPFPGVFTFTIPDSVQALESFPDAFFNWIYIDEQHTYEGVRRGIDAA